MSERHFSWSPWSGPGHEHLVLVESDRGLTARGTVEGMSPEGRPFSLRYRVRVDAGWRTRDVELEVLGQGSWLRLMSDGAGLWVDDRGQVAPGVDGCIDVDISVTPFTNTLPIRRLGLAPDSSEEVEVLYLEVPALTVRRSRQRYTCLGPRLYLFESLESDFRAELRVDGEGLVLDYPGLFRRLPSR
jgi:uncharacterized protein